jgi:endonuclease YncB( thermonuclease family)
VKLSGFVWLPVLVGCSVVGGAGNPASPTSIAPADSVVVTSVGDGDSLRAGGEEFRLYGINAPERNECFGDAAHQWLSQRIEGKEVAVVPLTVDQFDRIIVDLFIGASSISHEATATGHAFALSDTRATLLEGESLAMESGLGLWAADICGAAGPKVELIIDEVNFDPPGDDEEEVVVIRNGSEQPIDLGGFVLRDESSVNRFTFPVTTLAAGETVAVTTGCPRGGAVLGWCSDRPVWNNDGDAVILLDNFGRVVAFRRY